MPYPNDLEITQWAREAVAGTDLPATSKMITERFNPVPSTPENFIPQLQRGLLLANRGGEQVIQRGTNWTAEGPLTFEQAQHLFSGVIQNVAAPTGAGPYIWTHTRNPAAFPSLASYTFERRINDGATPIDQAWHYAMFDELELTFATNEVWRYNATGFARPVKTEALTAALTLPAHEIATVPNTGVAIDSTWATLGATPIAGQILSGRILFKSGVGPLWTMDNPNADLAFTQVGYASSRVRCEIRLTMLVGAAYATLKAAAEANTLRAVQITLTGTGGKSIVIKALQKHKIPELFGFDYDDEQTVVTLDMVGSTDGTNAWEAVVTNNVATFT